MRRRGIEMLLKFVRNPRKKSLLLVKKAFLAKLSVMAAKEPV